MRRFKTFSIWESHTPIKAEDFSIDRANDPAARTVFYRFDGSVAESIDTEFAGPDKGGIIVFSTDVNSVKLSKNRLLNWFEQKAETVWNRFTVSKRVGSLVQRFKEVYGVTIGGFVQGRYFDRVNNQTFDETSTSVEIIGVHFEVLMHVAEAICREFRQQTVLLKSYSDGGIFLVKP
jgi:hypothetical protein